MHVARAPAPGGTCCAPLPQQQRPPSRQTGTSSPLEVSLSVRGCNRDVRLQLCPTCPTERSRWIGVPSLSGGGGFRRIIVIVHFVSVRLRLPAFSDARRDNSWFFLAAAVHSYLFSTDPTAQKLSLETIVSALRL